MKHGVLGWRLDCQNSAHINSSFTSPILHRSFASTTFICKFKNI